MGREGERGRSYGGIRETRVEGEGGKKEEEEMVEEGEQ